MRTETTRAINTLITINNNRSRGYDFAANEIKQQDLKMLFTYFSNQSRIFRAELAEQLVMTNTAQSEENPVSPEVYTCDEIISAISTQDRKAILSSCEFEEEAAKNLYDNVMEHTEYLPTHIYEIISNHRSELYKTTNIVRSLYFTF